MNLRRDQSGSGLIMALVMVTVIGLLLTAVLGLADGSITTAAAIRDQGKRVYSADAGVEAAIQMIRKNPQIGRDPAQNGSCTLPQSTIPGINGKPVTLRCVGQPGSGWIGDTPNNKPGAAILTLATSGAGIDRGSNGTIKIRGGVTSNTTIASSPGIMNVTGPVYAAGTCSGNVFSWEDEAQTVPQPIRCFPNSPTPFPGADPGYEPEISVQPPTVTVPDNCPSGWRYELEPGTYSDAEKLSDLSDCGLVLWFGPGNYYFKFTVGTKRVWEIKNAATHIVGGTPKGWDPAANSRPIEMPFPDGTRLPDGSKKSGCDPFAPGVQFIFGGESQLAMTTPGGTMELCADPHFDDLSKQRIALFQYWTVGTGFGQPDACVLTSCPVLTLKGNATTRFYSHGTVYLPASVVDMQLTGQSQQILGRGVICRKLVMFYTPAVGMTEPLIQTPLGSESADRIVEIIATVDGVDRVRALVEFRDQTQPGHTVVVKSWSVRR